MTGARCARCVAFLSLAGPHCCWFRSRTVPIRMKTGRSRRRKGVLPPSVNMITSASTATMTICRGCASQVRVSPSIHSSIRSRSRSAGTMDCRIRMGGIVGTVRSSCAAEREWYGSREGKVQIAGAVIASERAANDAAMWCLTVIRVRYEPLGSAVGPNGSGICLRNKTRPGSVLRQKRPGACWKRSRRAGK